VAKSWFSTEQRSLVPLVLLILAVSFGTADPATAESRAWTGEFLRLGAGARAMGMGNAYPAVGGDVYATYFNPAGLATMDEKQFAFSVRYLPFDRRFTYFAYASPVGPDAVFGISLIQAGTDDIVGRDLNGNATGALDDKRNAIAVSFAKAAGKYVSIGLNTKLVLWKLGGDNARAFGFDAGVYGRPTEHLSVSFVLHDIRSRFTWKSDRWKKTISGANGLAMEKVDEFPLYYTLGASYHLLDGALNLAAALEKVQDNPLYLDAGVSYEVSDRFALRTGYYHYTSDDEIGEGSPTFGMTLGLTARTEFDYAYVPSGLSDEAVHIISFIVRSGD
jgi:hypothetical protein